MHCLTDFKNFACAELDLFKPLTVLLGRNGSGKTNLIEGVELLATLVRGAPFNEITDIDRGGTFEVRGGLRSCIRFGREKLGLRFNKAVVRFDGERQPVDYLIEIAPRGRNDVQLSAERLQIGDRVLFDAMNSGGELMEVRYDNFSRGRNPNCQVSASRSVLSRYEEIIRNSHANNPRLRASTGTVQGVRRYLRNSYIFDPQPKAMREYARAESNPQLLRGGANLSAVLFALSEEFEEDEEQQATLQRITESPTSATATIAAPLARGSAMTSHAPSVAKVRGRSPPSGGTSCSGRRMSSSWRNDSWNHQVPTTHSPVFRSLTLQRSFAGRDERSQF